MPHLRSRYIEPILREGLSHKGIVGLFGHRQVGKTTLLEKLAKQYVTLDRSADLYRAERAAEDFLSSYFRRGTTPAVPLAIDECQLAPSLFPALKEFVRQNKSPGLFLLSGSVRFSSRKAIRESLTGRILSYELLPFSVSEIQGKPVNRLALQLLSSKAFAVSHLEKLKAYGLENHKEGMKYLQFGGLPGICFARNERHRTDLIESQLALILDRDLRLVCDTKLSLSTLRSLIEVIAGHQGRPFNLSEISRKARVSAPTLRKLMSGFESIFFLRKVATEGNKSWPVYYFEDQGEASYLLSYRSGNAPSSYSDVIDQLERLAYANLRVSFNYEPGLAWSIFQYRQEGGAYVPFAFRSNGRVIGFLCSLEEKPSLGAIRSAQSFRMAYPGARVVHLHPGKSIQLIHQDEISLPIELFF